MTLTPPLNTVNKKNYSNNKNNYKKGGAVGLFCPVAMETPWQLYLLNSSRFGYQQSDSIQ